MNNNINKVLVLGSGGIKIGEVGIVVAGIGYSVGMIDSYTYTILMGVIMITTVSSPILLRLSLPKN